MCGVLQPVSTPDQPRDTANSKQIPLGPTNKELALAFRVTHASSRGPAGFDHGPKLEYAYATIRAPLKKQGGPTRNARARTPGTVVRYWTHTTSITIIQAARISHSYKS